MNHITTPTIDHTTDQNISHLETCEKCRSRLATDVDLGSVRARILSEATTEPRLIESRKRATTRPWLIGVAAAAAVLVLFLPILFTNGETSVDQLPPSGDQAANTVVSPTSENPTSRTVEEQRAEENTNEAAPGQDQVLASGEEWTVSIWERDSEICFRHSNTHTDDRGTGGYGCLAPSDFSLPDKLNVFFAMRAEGDKPLFGEVLGFVSEDVDRLLLSFESGDTQEIQPQENVLLGYRGFGLPWFDATELGHPTTLEAFDGETSLGVYHHTPVSELDD